MGAFSSNSLVNTMEMTAAIQYILTAVTQSLGSQDYYKKSRVTILGARSKFSFFLGGCQGRRTGVGVTTVSNSLVLGGRVTKVLKNGNEK